MCQKQPSVQGPAHSVDTPRIFEVRFAPLARQHRAIRTILALFEHRPATIRRSTFSTDEAKKPVSSIMFGILTAVVALSLGMAVRMIWEEAATSTFSWPHYTALCIAAAYAAVPIVCWTIIKLYPNSRASLVSRNMMSISVTGIIAVGMLLPLIVTAPNVDRAISGLIVLALFLPGAILVQYRPVLVPVDIWTRIRYPKVRAQLLELPAALSSTHQALQVAHVSDLHLTEDRTLEQTLHKDAVYQVAQSTMASATRGSLDVFITGDITDQGRAAEWEQFDSILTSIELPLESGRLYVVPGNHDLSLTTDIELLFTPELHFDRQARRFIEHVLMKCPRSWMMLTNDGLHSVREFIESRTDYLKTYKHYPPHIGWEADGTPYLRIPDELFKATEQYGNTIWPTKLDPMCFHLLELTYPMVMRDDPHFLVIGLNSCFEKAKSIMRSGVGRLGRQQLVGLNAILSKAAGRCVIILVHHHVGIPKELVGDLRRSFGRVTLRSLALREARQLARMLSKVPRCILFHGHKHVAYHAIAGNMIVISGESVAYPSREKGARVRRYEIEKTGAISVFDDTR